MKTQNTTSSKNLFSLFFITLSSAGFGYALTNHFLLHHPNTRLLIAMGCFFAASVASWYRIKHTK